MVFKTALACLSAAIVLTLLTASIALAQGRAVAITVDDLPFAGPVIDLPGYAPEAVNNRLLAAFAKRHIPVTGFVIEKGVERIGSATGNGILNDWITQGLDLGNHTYSHPDIDRLPVEQIEEEIVLGETTFAPLMKAAGKPPEFFRFPFNHTGDTKAKHDIIGSFLSQRGYHLATCTIDTSDYVFNAAYVKMLARKDSVSAQRLRGEYLAYSSAEIDYYAGLNKQVLGYEPPQVMLLHDSTLNSDTIEPILKLFEEKGYTFVSLKRAQSDPAYQIPDTYITPYGPMWGYRWAQERKVEVNGRLEPDPPEWVLGYGKKNSNQP